MKDLQNKMQDVQSKLQNYDWRKLQKFTSPQAADDLNDFLEELPQNAGQTMLIIAAIVWCVAGGIGFMTITQMQKISEIRTELKEAEALKPIVPQITRKPVKQDDLKKFADNAGETYKGLTFKANRSAIVIDSNNLGYFSQFREAISHVENGGKGWAVSIDKFCVGRECERYPLAASLKINTVSVSKS